MYAAYLAYTDHEIGRVIQAVEDMGKLDNTLIIYISGDNGASAEGMLHGTPNELTTFNGIDVAGRRISSGWYDVLGIGQDLSHTMAAGGPGPSTRLSSGPSRSPRTSAAPARACASPGPATSRMSAASAINSTTSSTLCRLFSKQPVFRRPRRSTASSRSRSRASAWCTPSTRATPTLPRAHKTQYFEMLGNRAIYQDGWIAVHNHPVHVALGIEHQAAAGRDHRLPVGTLQPQRGRQPQADDLAAKMPDKLKELQQVFYVEAAKYDVLPLDNSTLSRFLLTRALAQPPAEWNSSTRVS